MGRSLIHVMCAALLCYGMVANTEGATSKGAPVHALSFLGLDDTLLMTSIQYKLQIAVTSIAAYIGFEYLLVFLLSQTSLAMDEEKGARTLKLHQVSEVVILLCHGAFQFAYWGTYWIWPTAALSADPIYGQSPVVQIVALIACGMEVWNVWHEFKFNSFSEDNVTLVMHHGECAVCSVTPLQLHISVCRCRTHGHALLVRGAPVPPWVRQLLHRLLRVLQHHPQLQLCVHLLPAAQAAVPQGPFSQPGRVRSRVRAHPHRVVERGKLPLVG
jgi:hypothetical protein